jgi:ribosomal protection tetracycline resistance protein
MAVLTLGILAHVDAGKTTLTERILFETGVIPALGSVEQGTTQTDTLALERPRRITIRAAVAAFRLGALDVQLIDTPGHADFIAEVERSLDVLDAVVLVVSAVEGVQPQTVKLARAVRAAGKPLIVFVNKIDRMGARPHVVGADVPRRLGLRAVAMSRAIDPGEAHASMTPIDWADLEWRSERRIVVTVGWHEPAFDPGQELGDTGAVPSRTFVDRDDVPLSDPRSQLAGEKHI